MLKYPQPGAVKTRLIPALGERRACELYRALVRLTLDEVGRLSAFRRVSLEVRIAGAPDDESVCQWLGPSVRFSAQGEGDLGQRMERAVREAFAEGTSSVVVIGADCAELTAERLHSAFRALESKDAVLGPAVDGGYYLIGMRRFGPELFREIQWSSERVLEQTLAAARMARIECELLDTLHDLDRPEDLFLWAQTRSAQSAGKGRISIIIPALNEAQVLPRTLEAAQRGELHEIIVVDGGSADHTGEVARSMEAVVLDAPRCRAKQVNIGAAAATGEYLLFLHADTLLPSDYSSPVRALLGKPGVVGGVHVCHRG
ncbi:MAG: TIGR04282 family arsenosugar biosynthesis glycosyltransferase [Verrucomicrobiales bacterium]|nr:TIGR04282 family arsenosugar biosynthesis glycosyltransferase [Verrucomicrobiales bacterium]